MASEPTPPFQVRAIADYTAASSSELSLVTGQELTVTGSDGRGVWWQSVVNGAVGWFPASYVQVVESLPPPPPADPQPAVDAVPAAASSYDMASSYQVQPQQAQQQPAAMGMSSTFGGPSSSASALSNVNTMQRSGSMSTMQPASAAANSSAAAAASQPKRAGSVSAIQKPAPAGTGEKPPAPTKTHTEKNKKNVPTTIKVQIVEGRDLRPAGEVKKTNPTAFVYMKSFNESKERLFEGTTTIKATTAPRWNESFTMCVNDAEMETIIVRVVSGKDAKDYKDAKKFLGEVQFPLRGSVRDYDAPNGHYKWHNLTGKDAKGQLHIFVEYTDTRVTSAPTNFVRVSHIGWSADGGFDISNIPAEWKRLFKSVGIKKSDLEDKELAKKVFDIVQNYESNGGDVSTAMESLAPPPPPPSSTAGAVDDQAVGQTYQVWDDASQAYVTLDQAQYDEYMRSYNEYAAQYQAWQEQQAEYERQMAEYNAALAAQQDMPPPPPMDDDMPPPPPMDDGDLPPPPPMDYNQPAQFLPSPRSPRPAAPPLAGAGGGAGPAPPPPPPPPAMGGPPKPPPSMPKVSERKPPAAPAPADNRDNLLSSIRNFSGGLKSAASAPPPPAPAAGKSSGGGSLQDMLRNAMTSHRRAMEDDDGGDDAAENDDDW